MGTLVDGVLAPCIIRRGAVCSLRVGATLFAQGQLPGAHPPARVSAWTGITQDRFATLAPGQSVAVKAMVPIKVRKDAGETKGSALGPGDYAMSVVVSLWQGDDESAETWRKRLEPRGPLVLHGPESQPIAFAVTPHHAVSCPD